MSAFTDPRSEEIIRQELCTNGTVRIREWLPAFQIDYLAEPSAIIYRHARSLEDRAEPCNIITLTNSILDAGQLEQVGGADKIVPHIESDEVVRSAALSLQTHWQRREAARIGKELAEGIISAPQAQSDLKRIEVTSYEADDEPLSFEESEKYEAKNDPLGLLGTDGAWVMRKECGMFFGPSGCGKSTTLLHASIKWVQGEPWFGIETRRPLRILIIQAENNDGDCHRAIQGICKNFGISPSILKDKIFIHRLTGRFGEAFARSLHQYLKRYDPDLVIIDPIFSFSGVDLSLQQPTSHFLRGLLDPIIRESNAGCFLTHHSSKPLRGPNKKTDDLDLGNTFFGSVELSAYPRSVTGLHKRGDGKFELFASKRGALAGLRNINGEPTERIVISHAHLGIGWELVEEDFEPGPTATAEKKDRIEEYFKIRAEVCPESYELTAAFAEKIMEKMVLCKSSIQKYEKRFKELYRIGKSLTLR